MKRAVALLVAALAFSNSAALAAGPGGWDHLADGGTPGSDSLNATASSFYVDAPFLIIGGAFTDAAGTPGADRIIGWNGSNFGGALSQASSRMSNGSVDAIARAPGGKIYAGGTFQNAGGDANADFLAEWDGVTWKPFCNAVGPAFGGNVDALQVIGSTLYVGGEFQDGAGIPTADYLLACDLNTGVPSATTVDPAHPFSGPVYALTADANGALYAAGRFLDLENIPAADNVAYLAGGGWHPMGSGGGPCGCAVDGFVRSLTAAGTDVYVGTDVKDVAGIAQADNVVKWDGTAWSAVGANAAGTDGWFPATTTINGLTTSAGNVYATGSFQDAGANPAADNVAGFIGGVWQALGSDGAGNGPWIGNGLAVAVLDKHLYAAGGFTSAGGDPQARGVASFALNQVIAEPTPTVTPAPPDTMITAGPAEGSTIRDATPTFTFTSNEPFATFTCIQPTASGFLSSPCTSPLTTEALPDGDHAFRVAAVTSAGEDPTPVLRKFTIDTAKPTPDLSGLKTQNAGPAVGVTVSCGKDACKAVASGTVSVPGAAKVLKLRPATKRIGAGRKAKLKLGVPKSLRRAIRRALDDQRRVTAKITVRVTDTAGNARTARRSVKLQG